MAAKEDLSSVVDAEGSKFALSSLACAAISTFVFAELYHMRRADTVRGLPQGSLSSAPSLPTPLH